MGIPLKNHPLGNSTKWILFAELDLYLSSEIAKIDASTWKLGKHFVHIKKKKKEEKKVKVSSSRLVQRIEDELIPSTRFLFHTDISIGWRDINVQSVHSACQNAEFTSRIRDLLFFTNYELV